MINVLHLGLSYACNMRCKHCYVHKGTDSLDLNAVKDVIKVLVDNYGLFIVYYTYGEPLLASSFNEITRFCNNLNLVQILMTNGSLINEKTTDIIVNNGFSRVYVSLDSSEEKQHDSNRNYDGAYISALRAIEMLKERGVHVGIATTVTATNVHQLDDIWQIALKSNVDAISFLRERTQGRIFSIKDIDIYLKFVEDYLIKASHKRSNLSLPNLFLHDPTILSLITHLHNEEQISDFVFEKYYEMNKCHYDSTLSIDPGGNIYHCNLVPQKIGQLSTQQIDKILERKEKFNEHPICCSAISWADK